MKDINRVVINGFVLLGILGVLSACGGGGGAPAAAPAPAPALAPFNTSCLPLVVIGSSHGYGSYTLDTNGDMLLTVETDIRKLDRVACTVSTVALDVSGGAQLLGMTFDDSRNTIYVGTVGSGVGQNSIFAVNPTTGVSSFLVTMANSVNGLTVAPATYGAFGGQLIVAVASSGVFAVDQSQVAPVPVLIGDPTGSDSDVIFGADGTLYVASGSTTVNTLAANGTVTTFATGLAGTDADGLAIDDAGGRLLIADSLNDSLLQATIPGGVVSTLVAADFDDGSFPSAIVFDGVSNVIMGLGEFTQTITAFGI